MYYVDLNSDLGESFGNYTIGMDEEILKYVSSANVACGWHAGDPMVMEKTVAMAKEYKTAVGAHPGFPDLMGFGRRNMNVTPEEAKAIGSAGSASGLCEGPRNKDPACEAPRRPLQHGSSRREAGQGHVRGRIRGDKDIIFMGLAGSWMVKAAEEDGP